MTITLEMLWWRLYPYPPLHCINIVLIIDDLTVVKTTISRKELSDMRDISLIFTTKNQTESLPEIDNQVILKTVVHLPFAREERRNAGMTDQQTDPHHHKGKRCLCTSTLHSSYKEERCDCGSP